MNQERLLKIVLSPHISEKGSVRAEKHNEYIFQVIADATKPEVKSAVEFLFNVKVTEVRILNVKPKQRLFRGLQGKRKGWKKAYVTLQSDHKLDFIGAQ
jgi:large subunit ribosomal protein L23